MTSVFFESVTWDEWTVGFEAVPGGKGNEHRSVLSYHFYIPPDVNYYDHWITLLLLL